MSQPGSADTIFSRWLVLLLDCFSQTQRSGGLVVSKGVERELNVFHHQPHLIPPMKLVFYDEMPKSPGFPPNSATRVSHWVSQGKDFALKTSDRASFTIKKKLSKQSISAPLAVATPDNAFVRRQHFRPLELSIYLPGNRLSDLPEFENVDFTEAGEIQIPPKALIRTRSDNVLRSFSKSSRRPRTSMVGERQLDYWQQRSASMDSQRPPSAFEGLSSHPVCWTSLPGLPPEDDASKPLSPMAEEEEFSPVPDNVILDFPPIHEEEQVPQQQASPAHTVATATTPPLTIQLPFKKALCPTPTRQNSITQTRISQWLSLSTTTTRHPSLSTPAPVFPQFYQQAISPPPQHQHQLSSPHSHSRSRTLSISTFASTESLASLTSMTTAPTTIYSPRSRSGTLKSLGGKRVTIVREEKSMPDPRDMYAMMREVDIVGKRRPGTGVVVRGVAV